MTRSIHSDPFQRLAAELIEGGFVDHGARLQGILDGVWTTSSEFLGELGTVVLAIRRECRPLTPRQKKLIQECLKEVRKAWPGFGILSAFTQWGRPPDFKVYLLVYVAVLGIAAVQVYRAIARFWGG